jgi:hypothetical protein
MAAATTAPPWASLGPDTRIHKGIHLEKTHNSHTTREKGP